MLLKFKQFSLSFPDVSKNKGVAETAPLSVELELKNDQEMSSFNAALNGRA